MRQLSTVFGTSELAVVTVLAAYMAGLAAGAAIAARVMHKIRRPVLVYGILEAAIALAALLVPFLLQLAGLLYSALYGAQPEPPNATGAGQTLFYLSITFVILMIPTACMGATLPMLMRYAVRTDDQVGPRVGLLYSLNTTGAIAGTVAAAFFLLPSIGLLGTIVVGAIINLMIFAIAALLAKRLDSLHTSNIAQPKQQGTGWRPAAWILPVMAMSGFATFCYEVLWTRLLSHILGGSIIAFATMLASFLAGIAIGSAIATRLSTSRATARLVFVLAQLAIALTSLLTFTLLDLFVPDVAGVTTNAVRAVAILLPTTLFIGATFPLAVRILSHDERNAAQASARVYAWNTVGAVVGALIAGFYLIPLLRYQGTIQLIVLLNIALALIVALSDSTRRPQLAGASMLLLLLAGFLFKPESPEGLLRVSPLNDDRDGRIRFFGVGRSATVLMLERGNGFYLRSNGLPEATIERIGAPPSQHSQRLLSLLPVAAHPDAESMLIVGYGGGVVAESIPSSIQDVDIIELEPEVIRANAAIGQDRKIDPLSDSRIRIIINDARNTLRLTKKHYDILVSQPSHPWTAGSSHLYTREFMQLANSRLSPDGVFLQWIDVQFLSEELLRSLIATLTDVFPHTRAYHFQPNVLFFLASNQAIDPENATGASREFLASHRSEFINNGIASVSDLVAALAWDDPSLRRLAADAPIITDNDNQMAMLSSRAFETKAMSYAHLKSLLREYGPLFDGQSGIHKKLGNSVSYQYIGDRLAAQQAPELMQALSKALKTQGHTGRLLMLAKAHQANGEARRADQLLITALRQQPDDAEACYLLFAEHRRRMIVSDQVPQALQRYSAGLAPDARAVLKRWDAALQGDYQAARELDQTLAMARPENPWYLRAVILRAGWRNDGSQGNDQIRRAAEALTIVDEAIAYHQDLDLYAMRIASASLVSDYHAIVETARHIISLVSKNLQYLQQKGDTDSTVSERHVMTQRLVSVRGRLSAVKEQQQVPDYLINTLNSRIDDLLSDRQE